MPISLEDAAELQEAAFGSSKGDKAKKRPREKVCSSDRREKFAKKVAKEEKRTEPVALPPKRGPSALVEGLFPWEVNPVRRPRPDRERDHPHVDDHFRMWMSRLNGWHVGAHPDPNAPNFAGWRGCLSPRGDPLREGRFSV